MGRKYKLWLFLHEAFLNHKTNLTHIKSNTEILFLITGYILIDQHEILYAAQVIIGNILITKITQNNMYGMCAKYNKLIAANPHL